MYPKAEILFPYTLIPKLRQRRGEKWAQLVDRVAKLPENDPDTLAFCLLMMRINACLKCYSGSYKFMRGCEACSLQSISQFKGNDDDLLELYGRAQQDIQNYLDGKGPPPPEDDYIVDFDYKVEDDLF